MLKWSLCQFRKFTSYQMEAIVDLRPYIWAVCLAYFSFRSQIPSKNKLLKFACNGGQLMFIQYSTYYGLNYLVFDENKNSSWPFLKLIPDLRSYDRNLILFISYLGTTIVKTRRQFAETFWIKVILIQFSSLDAFYIIELLNWMTDARKCCCIYTGWGA